MRVLEISESVHGELPLIGKPCTIVRFEGCNILCPYCDVGEREAREMTIEEILEVVERFGNNSVLITGGEPLIHPNIAFFLRELSSMGFNILVETNGTVPLTLDVMAMVDHLVMDVKLFKGDFKIEEANLRALTQDDAVKFVYDSEQQIDLARTFLTLNAHNMPEGIKVIFSPVMTPEVPTDLFAEKIYEISKSWPEFDVRLQIQLHKILGLT